MSAQTSTSRRRFLRDLGVAGLSASWIAARGREAAAFWDEPRPAPNARAARPILLGSNENPLGPGESALLAIHDALQAHRPGRYPDAEVAHLGEVIAGVHGVKPENVVLGCGSTQILRTVGQLYLSPTRALVGSLPTYEECGRYAELVGAPSRAVPLDSSFRLDLGATLDAAVGAGLVFFCNPNNPTATVHPASAVDDFVETLHRRSPSTTILIDEAYHDYVTDPGHRTQIPRAVQDPRVIVARTFSKAHGMAGLRVGYAIAHPATAQAMNDWDDPGSINSLAAAAAIASIQDPGRLAAESRRNAEVRAFTTDFLARLGCPSAKSETNFLLVNIGQAAKGFREACLRRGVRVARDFPPLEKTHCRISLGTMDEMKRATAVFREVLTAPPA
jgi:histidinol-phosphate aminotransferase